MHIITQHAALIAPSSKQGSGMTDTGKDDVWGRAGARPGEMDGRIINLVDDDEEEGLSRS